LVLCSVYTCSHDVWGFQALDSGSFKTIVAFECRGLEPVAFDPRVSHAAVSNNYTDSIWTLELQGGFSAIGENSGSHFLDISLANKVLNNLCIDVTLWILQ
jgi:hypothetical protein